MNKRKKILSSIVVLLICAIMSYAIIRIIKMKTRQNMSGMFNSTIYVDNSNLKDFNVEYDLNTIIVDNDETLEKEIKRLTKEVTYLLLGGINNVNETSDHYYKRKQDWLKLFYDVKIPKDADGDDDTSSLEYKYDVVAGITIPSIFPLFQEAEIVYNSYGDIIVSETDKYVISTILLPNVKMKEENKEDPMKYDYVETDYYIHYYFMKLDGKYRLFYLYGEDTSEMSGYFNSIAQEEKNKSLLAMSYESSLNEIYNFDKLKGLSTDKIYKFNYKNMVFLTSYYNNQVVASSNGFFIANNLVITTWDFVQKSLLNAQYIAAINNGNVLDIEGIVTANIDYDIAIIKVKEGKSSIVFGDYKKIRKEDPVIMISSKLGTNLNIQTGIILSNTGYIQTSIPISNVDTGSPIFNQDGEVIGMTSSKLINSTVSMSVNSDVLKEIRLKFTGINSNEIESISFDDFKTRHYYVNYSNEKVINKIPVKKWKSFSKIGDIENSISLELVKAYYMNGVVSLRYKNEVADYISSMQVARMFRNKLLDDGYKLIGESDSKEVYQNKEYKVIIMDEFNYLIVVMVKL